MTTESNSAPTPNPLNDQFIPLLPWITASSVFLVYVFTLAPSIVGGDTSEFSAVACATGVAHPPGYPLFTILLKILTFIPIGSVAWRANCLSALCDSIAAVFIFLAVRRWANNQWAALAAAGLFAFSQVTWTFSVVAEVFPLNNLLLAALLYIAVRFNEDQSPRVAYLAAFVVGLGISNHHTSIFYSIPIMLWLLIRGRSCLWTMRRLSAITSCLIAGLLPYLYLPIADMHVGPFSWGNTSTLKGFLTHFFRREYGTLSLGADPSRGGDFWRNIFLYFRWLPKDLVYVGPILAVVGLYRGFSRRGKRGLMLITVIAFAFYMIVFHLLANLPTEHSLYVKVQSRFWQQATLLVCVWAGLGFAALSDSLSKTRWQAITQTSVAVVILLSQVATHGRAADQSSNLLYWHFARELLRPLPPNAIFFSREDSVSFPVAYIQQCEAYRTDVRVIDRELLKTPWMKRLVDANFPEVIIPARSDGDNVTYLMKQILDANAGRLQLFANHLELDQKLDWNAHNEYQLWPFGMITWIVPANVQMDPHYYVTESQKALPQLKAVTTSKHPDDPWEDGVIRYHFDAHFNRANHLINWGIERGDDRFLLESGAGGLEYLTTHFSVNDPAIFETLSDAYMRLTIYDAAYRSKADDARIKAIQLR